jgi:ribulose-phosphate 3-epimerase
MNPVMPSILTGRFFELETKLKEFASCGVEMIHLDVMDGHFVPNLSFGPSWVKDIKTVYPFAVDAHLMVDNPVSVVPWFIKAGADWVSIHVELADQIDTCLIMMRQAKVRCGLVVNPDTAIEDVFPFLDKLDYCLLMSVYPGYGGQAFIPKTLGKIKALRKEIDKRQAPCLIQVDGGIKKENASSVIEAGADWLVVGSALYGAEQIDVYYNEIMNAFGEKK